MIACEQVPLSNDVRIVISGAWFPYTIFRLVFGFSAVNCARAVRSSRAPDKFCEASVEVERAKVILFCSGAADLDCREVHGIMQ